MKRNTLIRIFALTSLIAATAVGCKDDSDAPSGEPAVLAIQNADAELRCLSMLDSRPQSIDIRALATTHSTEHLTVRFKVDRAQVEAYNQTHGTTYEMAPAEAYDFSKNQVILPRYNDLSSTAQVALNVTTLPDDGKQYLLPVTFEEIKGDDQAQVAQTGGVFYILFQKRVIPAPILLDRTNWKVVSFTSEYTPGEGNPKTGWVKDLLDGNPASYWNYNYKAAVGPVIYVPLYIVFDMGEEITVRGVQLTSRTDLITSALKNPPCDITIETSKSITGDGMTDSEWTYSERFNDHVKQLPYALQNSVYLSKLQRARYIRFTLNMSWNGASARTYKGGCFAEFDVWGNLEVIDLD